MLLSPTDGRLEEAPRPSVTRFLGPVTVLALTVGLPVLTTGWGLSYPGFPLTAAFLLFVDLVASVVLASRWLIARRVGAERWSRSWWLLGVGAGLAACGFLAASHLGDAPLHARWAASSAAFEAEVATLGTPDTAPRGGEPAFIAGPGSCPPSVGTFAISHCYSIDGGYLFLQAPDAVTDDSGIAYFPAGIPTGPEAPLNQADLTPLGGPWWAWTCNC